MRHDKSSNKQNMFKRGNMRIRNGEEIFTKCTVLEGSSSGGMGVQQDSGGLVERGAVIAGFCE